jgi:hypothetical protein
MSKTTSENYFQLIKLIRRIKFKIDIMNHNITLYAIAKPSNIRPNVLNVIRWSRHCLCEISGSGKSNEIL